MSSIFPTEILEPNPPSAPFHKNAINAAANPPRLALIKVTVARFKNARRVSPSASVSGATHFSISGGGITAREEPRLANA